jgi:glutaredoxin 2
MSKPTLYHYVHCPFCLRVRMALGFLGINYNSQVLPYDDETTPVKMTGKKMLPIIDINSQYYNESLDIISLLDASNQLKMEQFTASQTHIEKLLSRIGELVHPMAMPYWIFTPEFSNEARSYFQSKKETKRGPFKQLVGKRQQFEQELMLFLKEFECSLTPFWKSKHFSINDILIASHLWGMYVVPEFQFPSAIHQYLMHVKEMTKFSYHQDFWI